MLIISLLLTLYNYLGMLLSVTAIVVTILLCNTKERAGNKNIALIFASAIILCGSVLICIRSISANQEYSIVPDIYGRTYDDAVNELNSAGFQGRLALASTNSALASADSRVVWQSVDCGNVLERGKVITFVIDDCFAMEYAPLVVKRQNDILNSWEYQTDTSALNWRITMPISCLTYNCTASVNHKGQTVTTSSWTSFDLYGVSMCTALTDVAVETFDISEQTFNIADIQFVGKLIPQEKASISALKRVPTNTLNGFILLPEMLAEGDYSYVFCFIDKDGRSYQWEHSIQVISRNEWDAKQDEGQ